jgi:hypothetical protein
VVPMKKHIAAILAFTCLIVALTSAGIPPLSEQQVLLDLLVSIPSLFEINQWFTAQYPVDQICVSWEGVFCTNDSITAITFRYIRMEGTIPESIGNLTNLQVFRADGNRLNGTIPASMANLPLTNFTVEGNLFSSPFPADLLRIPTLLQLSLEGNENLVEPWPAVWSPSISSLALARVGFTGPLPAGLASLSNLVSLDLSQLPTAFNGSVPPSVFNYPLLQNLKLRLSQLQTLPSSFCGIPLVHTLDISDNIFVNYSLPDFSCLTKLEVFNGRSSQLIGTFPRGTNETSLTVIDLSGNLALTGPIPDEASSRPWTQIALGFTAYAINSLLPFPCPRLMIHSIQVFWSDTDVALELAHDSVSRFSWKQAVKWKCVSQSL